jgi:hypothetical protein
MFGMTLEGKVGSIIADVKDDDDVILRRDTGTLHFEFTKEFASGLNGDAQNLHQLLRDGALNSASMPLDVGSFTIACGDGDGEDGIVVTAEAGKLMFKAANKEDANPQVKLRAVFPTDDRSHMWWVHHQRETVDVKLQKVQAELPGV